MKRVVPETMTVNAAIREHPRTVAVFNDFGVDACCGGSDTIVEAAERSGLELAVLIRALSETIGEDE